MEFVYVIPRIELFPKSYPHGVSLFTSDAPEESFCEAVERHGYFVERDYAERTPALKQVIPYSIVVRDGAVLRLRRTKSGGEARLHEKLSIGVGGHINPEDQPAEPGETATARGFGSRGDLLRAATVREVIEEELIVEGSYEIQRVGLLNDDSNPVGAVHVGLVQVIHVDGPVSVREVDQLEGSFATKSELERELTEGANFETWSSLLIPHLGHIISGYVATHR